MFRFVLALTLLFLSACSGAGSQYLGKWENVKNPKDAFSIIRNGDSFLVVKPKRNFVNGKELGDEKIPAVLEDGLLKVQGGLGVATFAYIEASDTLSVQSFVGALEFKRTPSG